MKPIVFAIGLSLVSATAMAGVDPTIQALQMKLSTAQTVLDQLYMAVAQQNAALETAETRTKWILDNWVPKTPAQKGAK